MLNVKIICAKAANQTLISYNAFQFGVKSVLIPEKDPGKENEYKKIIIINMNSKGIKTFEIIPIPELTS